MKLSVAQFPTQFPQLETERLVLGALTLEDKAGVFGNFSDEEVTRYLMQPFTSLEQAESIIKAFLEEYEQGAGATWAIRLKRDGAFIGTCSCELKPGFRGELGFDLSKAHWGRGYMSEAIGAIVAYGFESLELTRIEAHTVLLNSRAIHLLKRLGFQVDGVLRESSWGSGRFWDEVFFSLHRKDWSRS
jgi:ribosomal-protein-alanine N-acetyltransferase